MPSPNGVKKPWNCGLCTYKPWGNPRCCGMMQIEIPHCDNTSCFSQPKAATHLQYAAIYPCCEWQRKCPSSPQPWRPSTRPWLREPTGPIHIHSPRGNGPLLRSSATWPTKSDQATTSLSSRPRAFRLPTYYEWAKPAPYGYPTSKPGPVSNSMTTNSRINGFQPIWVHEPMPRVRPSFSNNCCATTPVPYPYSQPPAHL